MSLVATVGTVVVCYVLDRWATSCWAFLHSAQPGEVEEEEQRALLRRIDSGW